MVAGIRRFWSTYQDIAALFAFFRSVFLWTAPQLVSGFLGILIVYCSLPGRCENPMPCYTASPCFACSRHHFAVKPNPDRSPNLRLDDFPWSSHFFVVMWGSHRWSPSPWKRFLWLSRGAENWHIVAWMLDVEIYEEMAPQKKKGKMVWHEEENTCNDVWKGSDSWLTFGCCHVWTKRRDSS